MSKNNTAKKNTKPDNRNNRDALCPFCQSKGVTKSGFRENMFYTKCRDNNCCVTDYYPTKEEAKKAWNGRKVHLTAEEKIRLNDIAKRRRRNA